MTNNIDFLISPIDHDVFFKSYWDRELLYIKRNDEDYYRDILPLNQIDEYLARNDIKFPFLRMSKQGKILDFEEYTEYPHGRNGDAPKVDINRLFKSYNNGATIVLQRMKYSLPGLTQLNRGLEKTLGFRTETNVYITPANSQGFDAHYDLHGVFILQLAGIKTWRLYDIRRQLPLNNERYHPFNYRDVAPSQIIDLYPGDLLYMPRGLVHDAVTTHSPSIHIALTVLPQAWTEVLKSSLLSQKDSDLLGASILNINDQTQEIYREQYKSVVSQYLSALEF